MKWSGNSPESSSPGRSRLGNTGRADAPATKRCRSPTTSPNSWPAYRCRATTTITTPTRVKPATDERHAEGHAVEATFAFVDLAGFTAMTEAHGDAEAVAIVRAFLTVPSMCWAPTTSSSRRSATP